jgi:hypothetical protein
MYSQKCEVVIINTHFKIMRNSSNIFITLLYKVVLS